MAWVAASQKLVTLVPNGVSNPTGVGVDDEQNVFVADFGNNAIKELPHAFVDPTARIEPATAGSDALPVVLPPGQNLLAQFAPTSSDPWLNIVNTAGGVVSFNFTANTNTSGRAASINLLGRSVFVVQEGIVLPPAISDATMLSSGVFQLSLSNGLRGGNYTVLFATNITTPMSNWIVLGAATNNGSGLWQFTGYSASNGVRLYRILAQ